MVFGQRCNGKLKGNTIIIILRGNTVKVNPSLNPGPALKSATNILGLRQLQCLTSTALPLNIIITELPFSLPLQLYHKSLCQPRACPQECNPYPGAETPTVPYLNSITSKHYNSSVTFQLTITTLPKIPFPTPGLPSRVQPISRG